MASWTYIEFLSAITNHERARRDAKSLERRMKWARFPFIKSLSEFNLEEQTALTARQLKQLKQLNWLEQQYNLILLGPPGRRKDVFGRGTRNRGGQPRVQGILRHDGRTRPTIKK